MHVSKMIEPLAPPDSPRSHSGQQKILRVSYAEAMLFAIIYNPVTAWYYSVMLLGNGNSTDTLVMVCPDMISCANRLSS
jgi:hypothetical protein